MITLRKAVAGTAAAIVAAGFGIGIGVVAPAGTVAAPDTAVAAAKSYKNCTALNKAYKYGVKKSSSTKNVVVSNGRTIKKASKAKTSASLYKANSKLDRDKDGIACEK